MNKENLDNLINKYEEQFYVINNSENDEIFKWRAAKQFRDVWFSAEAKAMPFSEKFALAKKKFLILTDNSYVSPANGIVKIAEHNQEAVERLFEDYLFADDGGDLILRQNNMDTFLTEFDKLRIKYYPQSFKFKQDRHSASCYLAFFAPDSNYIYRYSEAEAFAQHIEFGKDLGFGTIFRLDYYYEMCDIIVEALKEHPSLLEKHFAFLSDTCYRDDSLHLLAFDLMYCCRTYNYYDGMTHAPKKASIKAYTEAETREKEQAAREAERAELICQLHDLELRLEQIRRISLLDVEVTQAALGRGVIIAQDGNHITVKFETGEKHYIISNKYPIRPRFENDTEIVEAFTEYERIVQQINSLQKKIAQI